MAAFLAEYLYAEFVWGVFSKSLVNERFWETLSAETLGLSGIFQSIGFIVGIIKQSK